MVEKGMLNKDSTKIMNVLWVFEKRFFCFWLVAKYQAYIDSFTLPFWHCFIYIDSGRRDLWVDEQDTDENGTTAICIYKYIDFLDIQIYKWKTKKKHGVDLNMNLAPTHKRLGEPKLTSWALIESQQDFLFAKQKESYVPDFVLLDGI